MTVKSQISTIFLKNKFEFDDINKRKIGSSTIGRQDTWILSSTLYINGDGVIVSKDSSKYAWISVVARPFLKGTDPFLSTRYPFFTA